MWAVRGGKKDWGPAPGVLESEVPALPLSSQSPDNGTSQCGLEFGQILPCLGKNRRNTLERIAGGMGGVCEDGDRRKNGSWAKNRSGRQEHV